MPTVVLERETQTQVKIRTWPEIRRPPQNALRVPLMPRRGQRIKMPRGVNLLSCYQPTGDSMARDNGGNT